MRELYHDVGWANLVAAVGAGPPIALQFRLDRFFNFILYIAPPAPPAL